MQINESNKRRLAIFFFYEPDGIVDDYVLYLLDDLCQNIDELLIVCNGKLSTEGRKKFLKLTQQIIVRDNVGFDVWAYKAGLDYFGWNKLWTFDEVIMLNATIMGPVYPFSEMFKTMDKRDLDFWGITAHHKAPFDPFGCTVYGYIPEHIQSHFIAVRHDMLTSIEFRQYWDTMPMINSYNESVALHESRFTKHFADKGFSWAPYIDTSDLRDYTLYPLLVCPKELVLNRRCPIFKRRSFFQEYEYYISVAAGQPAYELMDVITHDTEYDENLIWQNVLRTMNIADVKNNLQLNYTLPSDQCKPVPDNKKVVLVMHLYFMDLLDTYYQYACSMPETADIVLTTNSAEKKAIIEERFKGFPCHKLEVRLLQNRGRDVSALLVGAKDFILDYDYACYVHDKKVVQLEPESKGDAWAYQCLQCVLKNKAYVTQVLDKFEKNPRMGLLTPPPPHHAEYYSTLGQEWCANYEITRDLLKELGINVPISAKKEPIAPIGSNFWFRPAALRTLFEHDWQYEEFPKEPVLSDGTLLHAIERSYGYICQFEGFYPAWGMSDTFAAIEQTSLSYMLRTLNTIIFDYCGPSHFEGTCQKLQTALSAPPARSGREVVKGAVKKRVPGIIYRFILRLKRLMLGPHIKVDKQND